MIFLLTITIVFIFLLYFITLKKNRLNIKLIVYIAMFSAIAFMLSLIYFIRYPQDGGITLLSMLPIMLLSIFYGKVVGVTGGLVFGFLTVLNNPYIIHPIQFFLDYLIAPMALGIASIFGTDKRYKIFLGCLFAVSLSVLAHFISGIVFFSQFAPKGIGPIVYSFVYNFSSAGVEGILSSVVMLFIPIKRFKTILNIERR